MKFHKLFFLTFILFFSYSSLISQILPSYHGIFDKKKNNITQTLMELPSQTETHSGNVRGYYFQAPTNFTITGLRVPTDASTECQNIAVVRFNSGPPPIYQSYTNDFTQLHITICEEGDQIIDVSIPVSQNQYIGVYGCRGSSCVTSYGYEGNIDFNEFNIELLRSGMQHNLYLEGSMKNIYEGSLQNPYIGRVELYFSN